MSRERVDTKRSDNTCEERRRALSRLINQIDIERWHPPLLRWEQQIEQFMDMLGIQAEWLTTPDVEPKRMLPKLRLQRGDEEAWGV